MKCRAESNPPNPFERFDFVEDPDAAEALRARAPDWEPPWVRTQFFVDDTQLLVTRNASPDLSFAAIFNLYRGCEHGCASCYARRYHEFLGFSAGLESECRVLSPPGWVANESALFGSVSCVYGCSKI